MRLAMKTVVIAGGAGFIGSNFVRLVLAEREDWRVINIDALTYAGNLANLTDVADHPNYRFERVDIAEAEQVDALFDALDEQPAYIINFAAESHVDRSIDGPEAFVRANVTGTFRLLERARAYGDGTRYLQVSTDEVYGSLGDEGAFTETTPIDPSSPYSASKASADLLVGAYHRTFGLDTVITRCSNNYGPYQFPEKLIPLMVIHALQGKKLPVYGTGMNVRDWIHVEDHCRGILATVEKGEAGEVYNFGGEAERANLAIVELIADRVAGSRAAITFVKDRPGHDWRYAMDNTKARAELDWAPRWTFEDGMASTIDWYLEHRTWWQQVQSQEHLSFFDRWYGDRSEASDGSEGNA
jgi:dTDP-glucose 4,6-dehydratase